MGSYGANSWVEADANRGGCQRHAHSAVPLEDIVAESKFSDPIQLITGRALALDLFLNYIQHAMQKSFP
jgi:hypothetical protein